MRDINSAKAVVKRSRAGHARTDAQGEDRQYVPTMDANGLDELRTDKTHPLQDAVAVIV